MQTIMEKKKYSILPPLIMCKLILLSLFLPERGSVFGLKHSIVLFGCVALYFLLTGKWRVSVPRFMWIYVLFEVVCRIAHFTDKGIQHHVLAFVQILGVSYVLVSSLKTEKEIEDMIGFVVKAFAVYAIFGIIESLTLFNVFDYLTDTTVVYKFANELRFGLARNRGATNISINNGMMVCLALCLAAYKWINAAKKERTMYAVIYVLIFVDCFLTLSRAVWLDMAFSQGLIFLMLDRDRKKLIIAGVVAVLCVTVVGGLIFVPGIIFKVITIFDEMISSIISAFGGSTTSELQGVGNRLSLWAWVWDAVKEHKIFGVGYTQAFNYEVYPGFVKTSIEVMWLSRLYRTGLVGMIGYILFQAGSLLYLYKRKRWMLSVRTGRKIGLNYIMLIASVSYFVTQFSCSGYEDLRFYYMLLALTFAHNDVFLNKQYAEAKKQ